MKTLRNLYILQILLMLGMITMQGPIKVLDQVLLAIVILILFSILMAAARWVDEE